MTLKQQYTYLIDYFSEHNPDAKSELEFQNSFELLVAVMLSAQCTDKRVNIVTPTLFAHYPTPQAMAQASVAELYEDIKSVSYPNSKASHLSGMARMLVEEFHGEVPGTMEELTRLPGVGRKTANLVLGDIYGKEGYVCDTHCIRITGRLGITDGSKDPLKVEQQLRKAIPPRESNNFCHRMVLFGREWCTARSPRCQECPIKALCREGKDK